jgi:hypothetical protein
MKKLIVVHFAEGGVRILKGKDAKAMQGKPNTVTNPVIPRGIPPHEWKMGPEGLVSAGSSPRPTWQWVLLGVVLGASVATLLLKI